MKKRQHKENTNRCQCNRNRDDEVDIIFPFHSILQWILFRHKIALNKREMECKRYRIHQNLSQEDIRRIRQLLPYGGYIRKKRKNKGGSVTDPHAHVSSLIVHEQVVKREAPHRKEDGEHRDEWIFVHGDNKVSILIVP